MIFNPNIHRRRSIRLKNYDYTKAGAYFVTICTQDRARLFGAINGGVMAFSPAGQMIEHWYVELENKFPDIQCDAFVCMPDHVHFIIIRPDVGADRCVCPKNHVEADRCVCQENQCVRPNGCNTGAHVGAPVSTVIQWFKTMTTNEYIREVKLCGWPSFRGRLWQRNYYEHIANSIETLPFD